MDNNSYFPSFDSDDDYHIHDIQLSKVKGQDGIVTNHSREGIDIAVFVECRSCLKTGMKEFHIKHQDELDWY